MKIYIGLGNPGTQYIYTRHNAGFLAVDHLRKQYDLSPFRYDKKYNAEVTEGMINNEKVLLIKPQTFMNSSGTCVRALMDYYKLSPEDLIVLHDELDLPFGTIKISDDSRAAGHNGVQNIIDHLETQTFRRIRIGVDARDEIMRKNISGRDYVLQKFSVKELEDLPPLFEKIIENTKKL